MYVGDILQDQQALSFEIVHRADVEPGVFVDGRGHLEFALHFALHSQPVGEV
jgi:hypothetical protein